MLPGNRTCELADKILLHYHCTTSSFVSFFSIKAILICHATWVMQRLKNTNMEGRRRRGLRVCHGCGLPPHDACAVGAAALAAAARSCGHGLSGSPASSTAKHPHGPNTCCCRHRPPPRRWAGMAWPTAKPMQHSRRST